MRQLNDHKGSIDIDALSGSGLAAYAEVCGELLARGHARSGDPLVIAGYLENGDRFVRGPRKIRRGLCRPDREGLEGAMPLRQGGREGEGRHEVEGRQGAEGSH